MLFPLIMRHGGEINDQSSLDSDMFESANKLLETDNTIQDE